MSADLGREAREAAEANVTESKPIHKRFYSVGWREGYLAAATLREKELSELREKAHWLDMSCDSFALACGEYRKKIATLRARVEGMEKVANLADSIAHEFEVAVESRNPVGGMSVPPTGDFISCAQLPSAVGRMRWWAREIRKAQPIPLPETKP